MRFKIRGNGYRMRGRAALFVEVCERDTTIDLGLLDESEAMAFAASLRAAADEIVEFFESRIDPPQYFPDGEK